MYEFYKKSGVSRGVLSQNTGLSEENISKFLAYASDVNPCWLVTGTGSMYTNEQKESDAATRQDKRKEIELIKPLRLASVLKECGRMINQYVDHLQAIDGNEENKALLNMFSDYHGLIVECVFDDLQKVGKIVYDMPEADTLFYELQDKYEWKPDFDNLLESDFKNKRLAKISKEKEQRFTSERNPVPTF